METGRFTKVRWEIYYYVAMPGARQIDELNSNIPSNEFTYLHPLLHYLLYDVPNINVTSQPHYIFVASVVIPHIIFL